MNTILSRRQLEEAAAFVQSCTEQQPQVGLVLGSGLGELAEQVANSDRISYSDIPHWPISTVKGHSGELVIGRLEGQSVMVMRGRIHYYEGYSMSQVTLPIRVMQLLKVQTLILTNAAGGIAPDMQAGGLMLIKDHINLIGMAGSNPLRGPNDESLGPRFPDMTQVYDPVLGNVVKQIAADQGIPLTEGIYVSLAGPSFETPAELRMLRLLGADAVGMSTVPEAIVARHAGMRVVGISGITNLVRLEATADVKTTHEEVLETGRIIAPRLLDLLTGLLRSFPRVDSTNT